MKRYLYTHPNTITDTQAFTVQDEHGQVLFTCQRTYSNRLKKALDRLLESKYFLTYEANDKDHQTLFTCKKISRKGRVYFEAVDEKTKEKYTIGYDGWQRLIPDLVITKDDFVMKIHKEMEDWSTFEENEKVIAKWRACLEDNVFQMELQISEEATIRNPAFYTVICQCILYIGG